MDKPEERIALMDVMAFIATLSQEVSDLWANDLWGDAAKAIKERQKEFERIVAEVSALGRPPSMVLRK